MNQGEEYRSTEYWDPRSREAGPGSSVPHPGNLGGWPGISGSGGQTRTEVLRPQGPNVFGMLVVIDGPGAGQIFRLNPSEPNTIGREYTCDIVIDEPAVSRQHAKIKLEKRESGELQFFIQDMATENGIEVNGEYLIKHYLSDGDLIKLGRATLAFKQV